MKKFNFQNLEVYQISKKLAVDNYKITAKFPDKEKFALVQQMNRAAVSVPSNIAEGNARTSTKDYINFLNISIGSLLEIITQIEISFRLGYIKENDYEKVLSETEEINKMLSTIKRKLRTRIKK